MFTYSAVAKPVSSEAPPTLDDGTQLLTAQTSDLGNWTTYYDNAGSALTLRGWWLCEKGGSWTLHVPILVPKGKDEIAVSGYEQVTVVEEILERVGLTSHADALRKGLVKNVEKLFMQAGVVPFARIHGDTVIYRLREKEGKLSGGSGSDDEGRPLVVALHQLTFDPKCAEAQAVANQIFSKGAKARDGLEASLAEVLSSGASSSEQDAKLKEASAALFNRGAGLPVANKMPCPEVVPYLQTWRPLHFRALLRAGTILVEEQDEEAPQKPMQPE